MAKQFPNAQLSRPIPGNESLRFLNFRGTALGSRCDVLLFSPPAVESAKLSSRGALDGRLWSIALRHEICVAGAGNFCAFLDHKGRAVVAVHSVSRTGISVCGRCRHGSAALGESES